MSEILIGILGGSVGAAIIGGVFALLGKKLDRKAALEDKASEKADKDNDQSEAISKIQDQLKAMDAKLDNLTEGTMATLGDRLKYLANKYISEGEISSTDLADWLRLHKIYHEKLKGNGYLDTLKGKVQNLPLKKGN